MNDIFTIANTHFEKFRQDGYNSIQEWLQTDNGKHSVKLKTISNTADVASILEQNYDKYVNAMKLGISLMENVLKVNGVFFRMYDIDSYEESPGGIVCKWVIQNKEYVCGIFANIDNDPHLKLAYIHCDIIMDSVPIYDTETPLPKWFVNGLKNSYC